MSAVVDASRAPSPSSVKNALLHGLHWLGLPLLFNVLVLLACRYGLDSAWGWRSPVLAQATPDSPWRLLALLQFLAFGQLGARAWRLLAWQPWRDALHQPVPKMARDLVALLIILVALCWGIKVVYHQSLETIAAASGILSLVLGFALRNLVSDVFSGIALHFEGNVAQGDWISFHHQGREITAQLIEYDWRCAVLHDRWNNAVLVPNGELARLPLTNLSRPHPGRESTAVLSVAAQHDHTRVVEILQNAADQMVSLGHARTTPAPSIRIREVSQGQVVYEIKLSVPPQVHRSTSRHHVLQAALGFLKAGGIPLMDIAYEGVPQPSDAASDLNDVAVRQRIIGQLPFFAALTPREHALLAQRSYPRALVRGHALIRAGEAGASMFVLMQGRLEVLSAGDDPQVMATLWPRDILGEMSLFTGAPRSATVRAAGPSVVIEIAKSTLVELFAENPLLVEAFAGQIQARQQANAQWRKSREESHPVERRLSLVEQIRAFFALASA